MEQAFEETQKYLVLNKLILEELASTLLEYKEVSGESTNYFKSQFLNKDPINIQNEKRSEHVLHKNKRY